MMELEITFAEREELSDCYRQIHELEQFIAALIHESAEGELSVTDQTLYCLPTPEFITWKDQETRKTYVRLTPQKS